jgi:hypothetical protein
MKVTGKVVIEFTPLEVERLLAILMDEDRDEALRFLRECLGKKIEDKIRPHCVPVFEASYSPGQKGRFHKKG